MRQGFMQRLLAGSRGRKMQAAPESGGKGGGPSACAQARVDARVPPYNDDDRHAGSLRAAG
eukprot:362504-Chlamydomonas_euryale.AAC.15